MPLLLLLASPMVCAQQPASPPAVPGEPKPAATDPQLARAAVDLRTIASKLADAPHAYTATVRSVLGDDDDTANLFSYRSARANGIDLLCFGELASLTCGDRMVQRTGTAAWTKPQGDMPDCPLSPTALLRHVDAATVLSADATAHDDRPAKRAVVRWRGEAAKGLLTDVASPDPMAAKLHENLPDLLARIPAERFAVEAALVYDPARRELLAATLRVALLHAEAADDEAPLDPGLPRLAAPPILVTRYTLRIEPLTKVPFPELDAKTRSLLEPRAATK